MRSILTLVAAMSLCSCGIDPQLSASAEQALTLMPAHPPMGWNGYVRWSHAVSETIVKTQADFIVSSGMKDRGYQYINLDGGWAERDRDASGHLVPNSSLFPNGIASLVSYVHSKGLKFGIYTSFGTFNCAETQAGSYNHYSTDIAQFASWGVDFVKFDSCDVPYPGSTDDPSFDKSLGEAVSKAIAASSQPMLFDINIAHDRHGLAWQWSAGLAGMRRVSHDISDNFGSALGHVNDDLPLNDYAHPADGFNDIDFLTTGNGGMTQTQYRAVVTLWALLAAPMIVSTDLTALDSTMLGYLTNPEVIAVDQDPHQGIRISTGSDGNHWVLKKSLNGGSKAVVLFNHGTLPATMHTTAAAVGLPASSSYTIRNVWARTTTTSTTGDISMAAINPNVAAMFVVSANP